MCIYIYIYGCTVDGPAKSESPVGNSEVSVVSTVDFMGLQGFFKHIPTGAGSSTVSLDIKRCFFQLAGGYLMIIHHG